jgi:hypothetical protein
MHIEVIDPSEKLAPPLGRGYGPPAAATPISGLLDDAILRSREPLNTCVWKVARSSVQWHHGPYRTFRRLTINGSRCLKARVVGSQRHWYFVATCASDAVSALKALIGVAAPPQDKE